MNGEIFQIEDGNLRMILENSEANDVFNEILNPRFARRERVETPEV